MEPAKGKCSKFLKLEFGHSAADLGFLLCNIRVIRLLRGMRTDVDRDVDTQ